VTGVCANRLLGRVAGPLALLLGLPLGGQQAVAEPGAAEVDVSDWDWGGFEVMGDTPLTPNQTVRRERGQGDGDRLTPEESAAPDLEADPRPAYALFPDMPGFAVIPSKRDREMHPCRNCHQWAKSNPEPRALKKPHDSFELQHGLHGKGRFWCSTCHDLGGGLGLKTLDGTPVDYGEAYIVCTQCHVDKGRDWAFGAHGKRLADWRGERKVYDCTACHYQHDPAWKPRQALAGPEMRQGLERPRHWVPKGQGGSRAFDHRFPWERLPAGEGPGT
jgi:hypothetical protein